MELLVMEEEKEPFVFKRHKVCKVGCPNVMNCRKPGRTDNQTGRQTLEVIIRQTLRVISK